MEKQKIQNYIIVIFFFLLVILGIYYYKNRANTALAPEEQEEVIIGEEDTPMVPLTKEEEAINKANQANAEELKAQKAIMDAKWQTAMNNARTAFGKKEYDQSIAFYNEALTYNKSDSVYAGLFVVYSAQNNISDARVAIDKAISLNPLFAEHWMNKLILLDTHTSLSFNDLKKIYEEGLTKIDGRSKVNFITYFARIAENNKEYKEAIALWEYAKTLYPQNSAVYQAEIDRLTKTIQ